VPARRQARRWSFHAARTPQATRVASACVKKHLGAAYVLLTEAREGYAYRLRAVGYLFEAEDESQKWPDLHAAIRQARKAYQADGTMPDWAKLEEVLGEARRDG